MSTQHHSGELDLVRSSHDLLTTEQVADAYALSKSTLCKWRCIGAGPRFVRVGRAVRYRKVELDAFVEGRIYASTAQADAG